MNKYMSGDNSLSVLCIEDSVRDAELIRKVLTDAGYSLKYDVVVSEYEYREKLSETAYDIILSDYNVPGFSGLEALNIAKKLRPDIPFIFVSGAIGEDTAVDLLKRGVRDYVLKERVDKLPLSVTRALDEVELHSARLQAEKALRESEEKYRVIFENILDVYYETSLDGRFIEVSPSINLLSKGQYNRTDLIGEMMHDYCVSGQKQSMLRALQKQGRLTDYEINFINRDGSLIICSVSAKIQSDAAGNPRNIIGSIRDITERKESEEKIRSISRHYQTILEKTPDALSLIDAAGNFKFINRASKAMFGYHIAQVNMQRHQDLTHPEDLPLIVSALDRLKQDPSFIPTLKYRYYSSDSSWHWVETTFSNLLGDPEIAAIVLSSRDITAQRRAEQDLLIAKEKAEEYSRIKSSFLANMSHELRTPLIGILGYSEILAETLSDDEQNSMASAIYSSGVRLKKTLNMILDISKVEANQLNLVYESCDIVPLIHNYVRLYSGAARSKGLFLDTVTYNGELKVNVDLRLLADIFNNLINNAISFTKTGGITVTIDMVSINGKEWAEIGVRDTGIGIDEKDYGIVFEEFRQVSEGYSRNFEGTGLGLTLTKKYIELMGGVIKLESELGKGTTFTVGLPVAKENIKDGKNSGNEPGQSLAEKTPDKLPVILCVENDGIHQHVISRMLSQVCTLEYAETGQEAIELTKSRVYECILMDINLGKGADGSMITTELRKSERYENIPIIAVTAFAMVGDKEEFIAAGCTDYISKPFTKKDLIQKVSQALKLRKKTG